MKENRTGKNSIKLGNSVWLKEKNITCSLSYESYLLTFIHMNVHVCIESKYKQRAHERKEGVTECVGIKMEARDAKIGR